MRAAEPLSPARIAFDRDGAPYAQDFGDVYHSADGGPAQARAVFLAGNDLPARWRARRSFTILETGFGLGLNFLCCAAALLADPAAPSRLSYVAVEKHPPQLDDLVRAHARWGELAAHAAELQSLWPPAVAGFHRLDLAAGRIGLTLLFGDAAQMLAELDARIDAVFFDGFAPPKNPAMWSEALFRELARLSGPGTTAATWSVAGSVRAGLLQAGFAVEKRAGFGRKREMLAAARPGPVSRDGRAAPSSRHALVIGTGLAGSWTAHALAARGWQVDVLERHAQPAQEASGNALGAVRPAFNLADNVNARLARAAFLHTVRMLKREPAWSALHGLTGVLQLATSLQQAERMAAILAAHVFSADYVCGLDAGEAARRAQHRVAGPGWWIPAGGWARPQALCRALIGASGHGIRARFGTAVHAAARTHSGWRVLDGAGHALGEAPVLVLANGYGARSLGFSGMPRLVPVRGQVSFLPPAADRALGIVVGGDGFVAPLPGGGHCIGSTFEPCIEATDLRTGDHARNLDRAERMLPGFAAGLDPAALAGWAGVRAATADRLPACGAVSLDADLEDASGGYVVTGLGARGLIWAPLCAEVLASRLEREPNPVERSLVEAMDPLREHRRSGRAVR